MVSDSIYYLMVIKLGVLDHEEIETLRTINWTAFLLFIFFVNGLAHKFLYIINLGDRARPYKEMRKKK
jgi:hypothetical protein